VTAKYSSTTVKAEHYPSEILPTRAALCLGPIPVDVKTMGGEGILAGLNLQRASLT
jgi:hypothetical protein